MITNNPDVVRNIISQVMINSPQASYKRLNPALRCVLSDCISADLPFKPDTFQRIFTELRGSWWFGDGAGSSVGEHYYSVACSVNHSTACQSFENFAGRPSVLWEEDAKTPERLHVGSRFTWKGEWLTVTSMRKDSLVACSYKDVRNNISFPRVGADVGDYDKPYVITSTVREGDTVVFRAKKSTRVKGDRDVLRRVTITYDEIKEFRRTENQRVKAMVSKIEQCNPAKDGPALTKKVSEQHFRHFQLELIREAFNKRKLWQDNQERVDHWRLGHGGTFLDIKAVVLRVRAERVECSNGNSVSLAAVKRMLPVVLARRKELGALSLPLDSYRIDRLSKDGVQIGCTLIPWLEVERLNVTK